MQESSPTLIKEMQQNLALNNLKFPMSDIQSNITIKKRQKNVTQTKRNSPRNASNGGIRREDIKTAINMRHTLKNIKEKNVIREMEYKEDPNGTFGDEKYNIWNEKYTDGTSPSRKIE